MGDEYYHIRVEIMKHHNGQKAKHCHQSPTFQHVYHQCLMTSREPWDDLRAAAQQCVEDALVQHMLPSKYGGALPNLW